METYVLTRLLLQRALGITYLIAFVAVLHQFKPLLGERGLLPVSHFVREVNVLQSPSIFFWMPRDWAFTLFGWVGLGLSVLVVLGVSEKFGLAASMGTWGALWLLYLSFVNVGQTWYSFGWEILLLETGFLAIFLGDAKTPASPIVIWLFRWLLFRVVLGAGLIKLRGDSCWRDLTCLFYYYETQPMPNPASWYFHHLPGWIHKGGVLFNHVVELIAPWGLFFPGLISALTGGFILLLMGVIGLSGNLAFLNFLTAVLALSAFSDQMITRVLPVSVPVLPAIAPWYQTTLVVLASIVGILSIAPVVNMISPRQIMNTSFNPLHLVNTYGAFGSITRPRYEVIIEGRGEAPRTQGARWQEYEFIGKPGRLDLMPPQVAPYHLRLDWLLWFAAFGTPQQHPWIYHLLAKLLEGDHAVLSILRHNPFPDQPPRFVRALLYEYHFTSPAEKRKTGNWWTRSLVTTYIPPVSRDHQGFNEVLSVYGWR